jgi:hypothetical protein
MPLQKTISFDRPIGLPGMLAAQEPAFYAGNFLSEGAGVTVGRFVWAGSTPDQVKTTGTGLPVGLVQRTITFPIYDLESEGTMTVEPGWEVTVIKTGRIFAVAATAATAGQKAFAVLADGTIKTGAAGASTASGGLAGTIETPWTVVRGGAAGALITLENC